MWVNVSVVWCVFCNKYKQSIYTPMKFKWFKLVLYLGMGHHWPAPLPPHPSPITFHPCSSFVPKKIKWNKNRNVFALSILCVNKFWHVILVSKSVWMAYPFSCDSSKFCHYLCLSVSWTVCNTTHSSSTTRSTSSGKIEYCFHFNGIICFNKYKAPSIYLLVNKSWHTLTYEEREKNSHTHFFPLT